MAAHPGDPDLDRLLAERGDHLLRAAIALAGNQADGEDLLQAALERLLRNRRRVQSDLEGYLRRILYNLAADGWRRRATRDRRLRLILGRGAGAADAMYSPVLADATPAIDLRDALVRLLADGAAARQDRHRSRASAERARARQIHHDQRLVATFIGNLAACDAVPGNSYAASGALGFVPVLSLLDADMIARGISHGDVAGSPGLADGLL